MNTNEAKQFPSAFTLEADNNFDPEMLADLNEFDGDTVDELENYLSKKKKAKQAKARATQVTKAAAAGAPIPQTEVAEVVAEAQQAQQEATVAAKPKKKSKFKKILGGILTGGVSTIIADRKKIGKGITKGVKAVAGAVKDVTAFSVLLPFVPMMNKSLKAKGLTPPKNVADKAELFYKEVVQKNSNSFDAPDLLEEMETFDGSNRSDHVAVAIIPPIIAFVKDLINKKKRGTKLGPILDAVATGGMQAQTEIEKEVRSEVNTSVGEKITANWMWIVGGVLVLIVVMVAMKK